MRALLWAPLIQVLSIWGELVEAYHGVNGYGGDTAEIYAFRLMPHLPTVAVRGYDKSRDDPFFIEAQRRAALALVELCEAFRDECDDVRITIDRRYSPCEWLEAWPRFEHRAHVRVERLR